MYVCAFVKNGKYLNAKLRWRSNISFEKTLDFNQSAKYFILVRMT